jgi:group I intron endonuclease
LVTNLESGTIYVGKTKHPDSRWQGHLKAAVMGGVQPLYKAIRSYGAERFSFEVVEEFNTDEEAYDAETFYIVYLRFLGVRLYNLDEGGRGGRGKKHSEATKAKQKANMRGWTPGWKLTPESHRRSQETRKRRRQERGPRPPRTTPRVYWNARFGIWQGPYTDASMKRKMKSIPVRYASREDAERYMVEWVASNSCQLW